MDDDVYNLMVGIQCFVLLLGGILASFVISAYFLFSTFIITYLTACITFVVWCYSNLNYFKYLFASFIGIAFGLFKFLFIVTILDQNSSKNIKLKLGIWFLVENLCYIVTYGFLPGYDDSNHLFIIILLGFNVLLITILIISIFKRIIVIHSNLLDLVSVIKSVTKKSKSPEEKEIIISISVSTIILFLMLSFGLCDSQEQYSYQYQSNCLKNPDIPQYWDSGNFWSTLINKNLSFLSFLIFLVLYYLKIPIIRNFHENMIRKIIIGNVLLIFSTIMFGVLETWRQKSYDFTNQTFNSNQTFNPNQISDISVFAMVPQLFMLSISEMLVIPTCYEFIYLQSLGTTKYFSVSLLTSVVGFGGIPDLIYLILYYTHFINNPPCVSSNKGRLSNLEIILYTYSFLSMISLIVSIILTKRFKKYFHKFSKYGQLHDESSAIL